MLLPPQAGLPTLIRTSRFIKRTCSSLFAIVGTLNDRTDRAVDSRIPAAAEETAQLLAE
jgi:hypothetical protein